MACCLIGAFLLGLMLRAARWARGPVSGALGRRGRSGSEPGPSVPTPVYELPASLARTPSEGRVAQAL